MAKVPNPRKVYNFRMEIEGVNQFEIQEAVLPVPDIEPVIHADTNHDVKTPGRVSLGDMELRKLRSADGSDTWAWDWMTSAQNMITGRSSLPSAYKRNVIISELDEGGATANRWMLRGCWVKSCNLGTLNRTASDNTIESVMVCVDTMEVIA